MVKFPKKKVRKLKHPKRSIPRKGFIFVFLFFVLMLLISLVFYNFFKPSLEIPQNEMTKIPPDIQKMLDQKKQTNSSLGVTSIRLPVLLYHYVEYVKDKGDKIRQSLNIEPHIFEKQVQTLQDDGYTFITAKDASEIIDGKRMIPEKPIILSFDDGYWDFYTDVFPIITKYKVKAVAYVVPGFIGNSNSMSVSQLKEVAKSPYVEIGAHTMNHVWLRGIRKEQAEHQIKKSKKALEEELGIPIYSFAYPYGAFDEQVIKIVEEAGFASAVSTVSGIEVTRDNRFFLYRLRPGARTGEILLDFLKQNSFTAY